MFRPMRRHKQALSPEDCLALLTQEKRGVLSLLGDEGFPYGIPMDHWLDPASGCLYFHCAPEGHKLDAMARCDKVSYCVLSQGKPVENHWALEFSSVVVFGRLSVVEDEQLRLKILRGMGAKFPAGDAYIEDEISRLLDRVLCLRLRPEHISGKRVTES